MRADPVVHGAAAWALTYLVHSTLLLAAAWLVTRTGRLAGGAAREAVWKGASFGALVSTTAAVVGGASSREGAVATMLPAPVAVDAMPWVAALVALGAVVSAGRGLATLRAHRAYLRTLAPRVPVGDACDVMRGGWVRGRVTLTRSSHALVPVALGRSEVCLPTRALRELSGDELRAVVAHELAHVARRDALWLGAVTLVERALWFQPLNRVALRELRFLAECACDDWALAHAASRLGLASALARAASWAVGEPAGAPSLAVGLTAGFTVGFTARESSVVARVRRLTEPASARPAGGGRVAAVAALVSLASLTVVGAVAPRVRPWDALAVAPQTIDAHDDAGPFTVTLRGGRVVGMTIDGRTVPRDRLAASDRRVRVLDDRGRAQLDLTLTRGGIRWTSRPAARRR